jgi:hypothetical protein
MSAQDDAIQRIDPPHRIRSGALRWGAVLAGVVVGHERAVEVEQNGALFRFPIPAALWAELKEDKRERRRIHARSYREVGGSLWTLRT